MPPVESIIGFVIASALLSLSPGPDNIFVLTQSALYGKKAGVSVTLGLCTGLLFHTTAVVFGIALFFQHSTVAFNLLKVLGTMYLLYLGWQAFRASEDIHASSQNRRSLAVLYRRGIVMNITNPKVMLFFLAFLPQFVSPGHAALSVQIFSLGLIFICVALFIFGAIALTAGILGDYLQASPKAQIILNRVAGAVFIVLAITLMLTTNAA